MEESSKEVLTANTHRGLLRFDRLVEGISCAGSIFQSSMDEMLQGIRKSKNFIDDIVLGGKGVDGCKEKLEEVLDRLNRHNVKINLEKSEFFKSEIEYLGHLLTDEGLKPCENKVKAIREAPVPKNLTQLKSYLEMINYYSKFLPNLSSELHVLYELTKKGKKFVWSDECDRVFQKSKGLLIGDQVLTLYDPDKPIVISCDASPYGIGAVLSHEIGNVEKPIMFASSILTSSERNYAQLHREGLAVVWSVKKFHKYIYGKKVIIYSDHEPLKSIFSQTKGCPAVAAARVQRWQVLLSMDDVELRYRRASKMRNADALSRLPLDESTGMEEFSVHSFSLTEEIPLDQGEIARETEKDESLREVYRMVQVGWSKDVDDKFRMYYLKSESLSIEDGCLFYGERIVIPKSLQQRVLALVHDGHVGVVRMKSLARRYVYWLNVDRDIEEFVRYCEPCQCQQSRGSGIVTERWPESNCPFERIHVDFSFLKRAFS